MQDSFILYNSFYEPIKNLSNEQLGKLFRAIFEYRIDGEITQDNDILIAFMFIKNQLDIDNNKYKKICERNKINGSKGGRPKEVKKPTGFSGFDEKPKETQYNYNYNSNFNYNNNNIYNIIEDNYNRILTPIEIEKIDKWILEYNQDILEYAINISVINNKRNFKYVDGILKNWKSNGYKTLQEIKDNEIKKEEDGERKVTIDEDGAILF